MITLNEIKNKMSEKYELVDKKKFFFSRDIVLDAYSSIVNFSQYSMECFIETLKINSKCNNKILNVNDIIFPLKRAYYYSEDFPKYGVFYIETEEYIYVNKEKARNNMDFYYELKDVEEIQKYASRLKTITVNNTEKLNLLFPDCDDSFILEIVLMYKEIFLKEYNNNYQNIFYKIEEDNDYYIVFKKNIDSSFKYITENMLVENKEKIYEILKNTDSIENDKIKDNKFNDLYYSYVFNIPIYQSEKELQKKCSLNMYSEERNELRLDYFVNGFLYVGKKKIYVFIFEETNSIYYFGDLEESSYRKMVSLFFPNFKINKFEKLL